MVKTERDRERERGGGGADRQTESWQVAPPRVKVNKAQYPFIPSCLQSTRTSSLSQVSGHTASHLPLLKM